MANHALAAVHAALRARKLDRTLTTALPAAHGDTAAIGLAPLDAILHGGLPRGELSEIVGARSSGRTTLLLQLVAAATRRGEIAALVDTFDQLDVASAVAANVDLDRLLWIRGSGTWGLRPPPHRASLRDGDPEPEAFLDRALKALNLVLQAGGFGVVAIDLADAPPAALRAIPFTTCLRVQRTIEGSDTACVIVAPQPLGRSAGGLTLMLEARPRWKHPNAQSPRVGGPAWSAFLTGVDLAVRVVSPRRPVDGNVCFGADVR